METSLSKVLEFKIPADTKYISIVRRGVRNLAESAGFEREEVSDVEVAVSEAVANSVKHGSPNPPVSAVVVKCRAQNDWLEVEVEDENCKASIPSCPDQCSPNEETGRGVLIMHTLMDEFEDSSTGCGTKIRMAKQKR